MASNTTFLLKKDGESANVPPLTTKEVQSIICSFYTKLLDYIIEKKLVSEEEISDSVHHLYRHYKNVVAGVLPVEINYNEISVRLAYIFKYAPCHACLVSETTSKLLELDVMSTILKKQTVEVMFIGSGPGNDMIGFLLSLYGFHDRIQNLKITNVDKMAGWEDTIKDTLKMYQRISSPETMVHRNIFKEINVTNSFVSTDLTNSDKWTDDFKRKLYSTDLLYMVKSFSHIATSEKQSVLESLNEELKPGCLIIFIDFPYTSKIFSSLRPKWRSKYIVNKLEYKLEPVYNRFGDHMIPSCEADIRLLERD